MRRRSSYGSSRSSRSSYDDQSDEDGSDSTMMIACVSLCCCCFCIILATGGFSVWYIDCFAQFGPIGSQDNFDFFNNKMKKISVPGMSGKQDIQTWIYEMKKKTPGSNAMYLAGLSDLELHWLLPLKNSTPSASRGSPHALRDQEIKLLKNNEKCKKNLKAVADIFLKAAEFALTYDNERMVGRFVIRRMLTHIGQVNLRGCGKKYFREHLINYCERSLIDLVHNDPGWEDPWNVHKELQQWKNLVK